MRDDPLDVHFIRSTDGGTTWSAPVRVNDDPIGNGKVQFLTWMAVDPTDGSVNVIFYDRRSGAGTQTSPLHNPSGFASQPVRSANSSASISSA